MLRPIAQPRCARALTACRNLQVQLLQWLCDSAVAETDITDANLRFRVNTPEEADWLWQFLNKVENAVPLLERARILVRMTPGDKATLLNWIETVITLRAQFQPAPPAWLDPHADPAIARPGKTALKELMEAFYTKGLKGTNGLPYLSDGSPTDETGVTYSQFVREFREAHRVKDQARDACVLCGGRLGTTAEVDHWLAKSKFPLLSVCGENLLPACSECNSKTNKGDRNTFSVGAGAFVEWFHPYLRAGSGNLTLHYDAKQLAIVVTASTNELVAHVQNLDTLLNLAARWTIEFKIEYSSRQTIMLKRIERGDLAATVPDMEHYVMQEIQDLNRGEPNSEIIAAVLSSLLEKSRMSSWQTELGLGVA